MPIACPPPKLFRCEQCKAETGAKEGWYPVGWMRAVGMSYLRIKPETDRTAEKVEITSRATDSVYYCPACQKNSGLVLTLRKA